MLLELFVVVVLKFLLCISVVDERRVTGRSRSCASYLILKEACLDF